MVECNHYHDDFGRGGQADANQTGSVLGGRDDIHTHGSADPQGARPSDHRCRRPLRGARAGPQRRDHLATSRKPAAPRCATGSSADPPRMLDTSSSLADRTTAEGAARRGGPCRRGGDPRIRTAHDRATAHLPALLYERLDEFGIDFTLLYPSMALGYFEIRDDELRGPLLRAVNRYNARLFAPYPDRRTSAALIPMNTPEEAVAELRYAVQELGAKSVVIAGHASASRPTTRRIGVPPRHVRHRQRLRLRPVLGDVRRARRRPVVAQRAAAAPRRPARSRTTCSTTWAAWPAATSRCASRLFLGGVTRRFPELRIGFLEGGVAWACACSPTSSATGRSATRDAIGELDPDRLDVDALLGVLRPSTATPQVTRAARRAPRVLLAARGPPGAGRRVRRRRHRAASTTLRPVRAQLLLRVRGRRPAGGWAFRQTTSTRRCTPAAGARHRHLALGRARHDRASRRGVRAGRDTVITDADFRDFTFVNPVRLHRRPTRTSSTARSANRRQRASEGSAGGRVPHDVSGTHPRSPVSDAVDLGIAYVLAVELLGQLRLARSDGIGDGPMLLEAPAAKV